VLNSLNHAQLWDNKVDTNIKGHYTHQDMLEVTNSNVPNPPHHNTIRSASGSSVTPFNKGWPRRKSRYWDFFTHPPSPLHLDVVLRDLHIMRDIEGAWNHFLKLVETEANQHVTILNGNYAYLYHSRYNLACSTCFHTCWGNLIVRTFPWMISRVGLQVIEFVRKDGMNRLTSCLWHHLVFGLTNIK